MHFQNPLCLYPYSSLSFARFSKGSRSKTVYGPQDVSSERKREGRYKHQLKKYYQEVIKSIGDVDKIWILGPGEAKRELEKEMKKSKALSAKIVGVEKADKMTERQIAAKVRRFFISAIIISAP